MGYWLGNPHIFSEGELLEQVANPRQGLKTLDNDYYIRSWYEVDIEKVSFLSASLSDAKKSGKKWFPLNHGGEYRKYFGNNYFVVNWENDGSEMKANAIRKYKCITRTITNIPYYFKEGITWSVLCSEPSFRWYGKGFIFSNGGQCIVPDTNENLKYLTGLLNSKISGYLLNILSPTLGFESGYLKKLPIIKDQNVVESVKNLTERNIELSTQDWNSFEISWDFKEHPFVTSARWASRTNEWITVQQAYEDWQGVAEGRFQELKANEEELNRIFLEIYGLQDELKPDVEEKDVTVRRADLKRDVKSMLSYAVGCMFGRYNLFDQPGLAFAGGEWDASKYHVFQPDADNVIPITDEQYLEDDIITRLCSWLCEVFGKDNLETNLDYIAKAIGGKGSTSREVIRNYFLNDFFKDHCQTYSVTGSGKRPIYWLFDSGKQNGFKALVYLHRYTPDTIGTVRVDYLHKLQRIYENEINRMQDMIEHSSNTREVAASSKRKEKLQKQLKECREYDEKLAHLALSRIELDLDDGVKVNYRKMQTAQDGKFYEVLADSKNIMAKEK